MAPKKPTQKTESPEPVINHIHALPFEDRMKGFDAEYKALSNKWGVYHLPVTIFDDSTIPGGRYGQQLAGPSTPANTETAKEV